MTTTSERARARAARPAKKAAAKKAAARGGGRRRPGDAQINEALRDALDLHEGSGERWGALVKRGATNAQIWHALRDEFGAGVASQTAGGIQYAVSAGASPSSPPAVWIGSTAAHWKSERPTLAGAMLVARVRELLAIPQLGAGDDTDGDGDAAGDKHGARAEIEARAAEGDGEGDGLGEAHAAARRAAERRQSERASRMREIESILVAANDGDERAGALRGELESELRSLVESFRGEQTALAANFGDDSATATLEYVERNYLGEGGLAGIALLVGGEARERIAPSAGAPLAGSDDAAGRVVAPGETPATLALAAETGEELTLEQRARLARIALTMRRLFADVAELDARIKSSKGNLKRQLSTQRAEKWAAFELEFWNAQNAEGFSLDVLSPMRERIENSDPLTLDELEAELFSTLGMIKAHDAEIDDERTNKRRRKQLVTDREPYLSAFEHGLAEARQRFGDDEGERLRRRVVERVEREAREHALADELHAIEDAQRERFARLLALAAELERDGIKARERERFEKERAGVREAYIAAFRDVAARWHGGEADAMRRRVEPLVETSDDERRELVSTLEAEQRDRWDRLAEIERQLAAGELKAAARRKLEKDREQTGAGYARGYAAAIHKLGAKAVEELRAKIEGDTAPPIFAVTPATPGAGGSVEQNPDLVFDYKAEIDLDVSDVAGRAKRLAALHVEIERLTKEKEQAVARFKGEIAKLEEESGRLFDEITAGRAVEEVKVFERRDYSRRVVEFVRAGTDQVVGSRPMKARELTPKLF